jgi:hypothetical protein
VAVGAKYNQVLILGLPAITQLIYVVDLKPRSSANRAAMASEFEKEGLQRSWDISLGSSKGPYFVIEVFGMVVGAAIKKWFHVPTAIRKRDYRSTTANNVPSWPST